MYSRSCAPLGKKVKLRAIFVDSCNEPISFEEVEVLIEDAAGIQDPTTYSLGNGDIEEVAPGMYELQYTVPTDTSTYTIGSWTDSWAGYTDATAEADIEESFSFAVTELGRAYQQTVSENSLVVVLLAPTIEDVDGRPLNEEVQITFSTRYNPYYASPDLVRVEVGTWLDSIPDDTLSLMIHWSSKEADLITPNGAKGSNYNLARTKFVIFDVALRCLTLPVAGAGNGTKQLGDLMIKKNLSFKDAIEDMKAKREEWFRVVNSNGRITPGQGFAPSVALKGQYHPEAKRMGRLWWNSNEYPYPIPAGNVSVRKKGQRKFRKGYADFIDGRIFPPDEEPD